MKRIPWIVGGLASGLLLLGSPRAHAVAVPVSLDLTNINFNNSGGGPFQINISSLPAQVFFGKHVLIPIELTSDPRPLNTTNLRVEAMYQLFDSNNNTSLGPLINVPIIFKRNPAKPNTSLLGAVVILRKDI